MPDGIVCATWRKKSSIYCSDAGSYCVKHEISIGGLLEPRAYSSYIDWINVSLMEGIHMTVG